MPLLLNQQDLRPLLASETFYPDLFQVIRDALVRQQANEPGVVSWLAFPTTQAQQHINVHLMTTPVEGASVPSLVGPVHHASGWDPFPFRLNGGRVPSAITTTLVDLLQQSGQTRQHEDEIVLYEQSGSFGWDGAILRWPYEWAEKQGRGTTFTLSAPVGGESDD